MEARTPINEDAAPDKPTDLPRRSWWSILKRTVKEFRDDQLTDWAAALTYYGVLALFPALLALVSLLGLVGDSAVNELTSSIEDLAPGSARDILLDAINNITASDTAGFALILGLAGALWSASGYVGAFGRASNVIYEIEEGRSFWKLKPFQLAVTAVLVLLVAICAIAVVVTGPVAEEIGSIIGVEGAAVTAWDIAKWPLIALAVITLFSILYWASPNVRQVGFRWITPGGILTLVLWLAASALFAFYVANFASYNATYGAIAGVIVFLVWLWITNLAMLLGAEFNAEIEREREMEAGVPEEDTLALEHRSAPDRAAEPPGGPGKEPEHRALRE